MITRPLTALALRLLGSSKPHAEDTPDTPGVLACVDARIVRQQAGKTGDVTRRHGQGSSDGYTTAHPAADTLTIAVTPSDAYGWASELLERDVELYGDVVPRS